MKNGGIPNFRIREEYGLHEFDLIPYWEGFAENKLFYQVYKYRRSRKFKIYLFYNCDILGAVLVICTKSEIDKIEFFQKYRKTNIQHISDIENTAIWVKFDNSQFNDINFFISFGSKIGRKTL